MNAVRTGRSRRSSARCRGLTLPTTRQNPVTLAGRHMSVPRWVGVKDAYRSIGVRPSCRSPLATPRRKELSCVSSSTTLPPPSTVSSPARTDVIPASRTSFPSLPTSSSSSPRSSQRRCQRSPDLVEHQFGLAGVGEEAIVECEGRGPILGLSSVSPPGGGSTSPLRPGARRGRSDRRALGASRSPRGPANDMVNGGAACRGTGLLVDHRRALR